MASNLPSCGRRGKGLEGKTPFNDNIRPESFRAIKSKPKPRLLEDLSVVELRAIGATENLNEAVV